LAYAKESHPGSLFDVLEQSRQSCFVTGADLRFRWASSACLQDYPDLHLADGISRLLEDYDLQPMAQKGQTFPLTLTALPGSIGTLPALTVSPYFDTNERLWIFFLRSAPLGAALSASLLSSPYNDNAAALFSANYRSDLFRIFSTLTLLSQTARDTDDVTADALRSYSRTISQQCYHLLRNTINYSAVLAYRNGALQMARKSADICAWLHELCTAVQSALRHQPMQVTFSIPEEPILISFSAEDMATAVMNVITNALQFAIGDEPALHITLKKVGSSVSIIIADNGAGMSEAVSACAFEPFFSYDPKGGPYAGVGMGLAAVRAIVGMHGGSVALTSREDQGTTVMLSLPIPPSLPETVSMHSSSVEYLSDRFSPVYVHLAGYSVSPAP